VANAGFQTRFGEISIDLPCLQFQVFGRDDRAESDLNHTNVPLSREL
jgi:hypothetical protein